MWQQAWSRDVVASFPLTVRKTRSTSVGMFGCFRAEGLSEPVLKTRLTASCHTRRRLIGNEASVHSRRRVNKASVPFGYLCKVTWAGRGKCC